MKVDGLAYLGLGVSDEERWVELAVTGLGLNEGRRAGEVRRLRMDDREWRFALHRSDSNDILYAGFDVADAVAASVLAERLQSHGIAQRSLTPSEISERSVAGGIVAHDPHGLQLEFVYGCARGEPFTPGDVNRFVTGAGGLGHIALSTSDPGACTEFYRLIGFRISDYIDLALGFGTLRITFLHCNERHHTLALAPLPGPRRLDHLMIEVSSVDEVIHAYNRLMRLGYTMKRHLGRHSNDRMLSFYVTTPAGIDIELGCQGVSIGAQWQVQTYDAISLWGHEPTLSPAARDPILEQRHLENTR
jgi:2,3-dihydroxybiphenyl 1,2-dioxygenase